MEQKELEDLMERFYKCLSDFFSFKGGKKPIAHGHTMKNICFYLCEHDYATSKELMENLDLASNRLAGALKDLEKKGFITRTDSPKDRRKTIIRITELGRKTTISVKEEAENKFLYLVEKLGVEKVENFIDTLELMHVTLDDFDKKEEAICSSFIKN